MKPVAVSNEDLYAREVEESRKAAGRLLRDRARAVEALAREAKQSIIEGCAEVLDGLSYVAAFEAIRLLAGAIVKDSPRE